MHLHLWKSSVRQKEADAALVKLTLPFFFENLRLKDLFCEPYALNPAPNKTLAKTGFEFVKEYITDKASVSKTSIVAFHWQKMSARCGAVAAPSSGPLGVVKWKSGDRSVNQMSNGSAAYVQLQLQCDDSTFLLRLGRR